MLTRRGAVCLSVLVIVLTGGVGQAHAVSCGTSVTGSITLTADLTCPTGHGLLLGSGTILDCGGHSITGGDQAGQYGIYVQAASNVVIQHCVVSRFEVGIRLAGATNTTVQDSTSQSNTRYGLEITQSSTGALVQRNVVYNNSNEGIHISGPTNADASHRILTNTVENNAFEGIYLLNSDANTISGNTIQNQGAAGLYVKGSNRNSITGNTLTNDPIQLAAGSQLNVLTGNTIVADRIKFDGASNNQVYTTTVQGQNGRPSNAYDLNNSTNITVVDSAALNPWDYHIRAANGSINNTFTRFTASPLPLQCFVDSTSGVTVTDPNGNPVPCGGSATSFSLTIAPVPTNGTLTGPGISCPSTCMASYASGTTVTLTATPAGGYQVGQWTGCQTSSGNQCTVQMMQNRTVSVTFTPISQASYTLTISPVPSNGTVTGPGIACPGTCSASYTTGTAVTLRANPSPPSVYKVGQWAGCQSTSGPHCTVQMTQDRTVSVTFSPK